MPSELVSAIMPTADRPNFAAQAIEMFLSQTWPEKELVIVDDGNQPLTVPPDERITLIRLQERNTIGAKRNIACEAARGRIIMHWDDDDFYAPTRMDDQVNRLFQGGFLVTGYSSMLFADLDHQEYWQYRGYDDCAIGVSLCYFKEYWREHRFANKNVGEDVDFAKGAVNHGVMGSVDAGNHLIGTIHGANTSKRELDRKPWRRVGIAA